MNKVRTSIGIITFHEPISYGATLQCLGLQMFLQSNNYKVEVIDYSSKGYLELRKTNRFHSIKLRIGRFLDHPIQFIKVKFNARQISIEMERDKKIIDERNDKFIQFRNKYYSLSKNRYNTYSELKNNPPKYDAYICGSDQIWNPSFNDMDDSYFLSFADKDKRIAYAPSFGVSTIPYYAVNEYKKRLASFRCLSVREITGQKIIKKLINKAVPVVIDPTFLVSNEIWSRIADESSVECGEDYILTYFIGLDEHINEYLTMIRKTFPMYRIVNLIFDKTSYGPQDFLKLIREARFVFTNSFHGVAFCINFKVPFAVGKTLKDYGNGSAFSRIENLLSQLGLQERIIENAEDFNWDWIKLDFKKPISQLDVLVDRSKDYLCKGIKLVVDGEGKIE